MDTPLQSGRAVRYACAVLADCRIGALPVDPFDLASRAGIMLLPLSQVENYPLWVPYDIADTLRMTCAVTLSYPTFCIVFRDTGTEPDRLRFALFHELGHIFMNHYRDFPEVMETARRGDSALEAEMEEALGGALVVSPGGGADQRGTDRPADLYGGAHAVLWRRGHPDRQRSDRLLCGSYPGGNRGAEYRHRHHPGLPRL